MKKVTTLPLLMISCFSFSQQNTIPTNGDVGIGTTNPTAKLDVS